MSEQEAKRFNLYYIFLEEKDKNVLLPQTADDIWQTICNILNLDIK